MGRFRLAAIALAVLSGGPGRAAAQSLAEECVPSPVPPPGVLVACLDESALASEVRVALVSALGATTGPAREEAREALMAGALVDDPAVHRAMRQALVRIGVLTAAQARGLPTLRGALRALSRAVGRDRAAIGPCRLELSGVGRAGVLELTSQTRYCADGAVLVGDFAYDPRTRRIRVLRAEIEHLR